MPHYHLNTAYHREAMSGHALDWAHQPHPFKRYIHRDVEPLPSPRAHRAGFFELALKKPAGLKNYSEISSPDAADFAAVLLMAAGITAKPHHGPQGGLRAPASAGALYPAEIYAAACGIRGLDDGLYHFSPGGPGLHMLRQGPLAAAGANLLGAEPAALTFFISTIFWRSLWKYRTRAYRYCLLDAGHMLANLELALTCCAFPGETFFDFPDSGVNAFLGLASDDEVALCAVKAGGGCEDPGPEDPGLPPFDLQAMALSARVGRDRDILEAHRSGDLITGRAMPKWPDDPPPEDAIPLAAPVTEGLSFIEAMRSRRSRRNFVAGHISAEQLSAIMRATLPSPAPFKVRVLTTGGSNLKKGVYRYHPGFAALSPKMAPFDFRGSLGQACLGQLWTGQAALNLVFWANLEELQREYGPRAYRHAMLAAGRAGQRAYLAATALGLGCCAVGAFYDNEVAKIAALPKGASPLYVVSLGPVKKKPAN